jgi:predicted  nucleic acid-binding Zn-ribbon protein
VSDTILMLCLKCAGHLIPSGQEVYRLVCDKCGQNYFVRLTIEPVPPKAPLALPDKPRAE